MIDELDLSLKPDSGSIVAEPEALAVTGIDLQDHLQDVNTITYKEGSEKLKKFLEKHKIKGKRKHYRPSGHNVIFDIRFVLTYIFELEDWEKLVHHRPLDTLPIVTFLQNIGMLPEGLGSLGSLVEYFDIPVGNAHNAKEDIRMTIDVYKKIRSLIVSLKEKAINANSSEDSILKIIEL